MFGEYYQQIVKSIATVSKVMFHNIGHEFYFLYNSCIHKGIIQIKNTLLIGDLHNMETIP